jgi:hypothetical protein
MTIIIVNSYRVLKDFDTRIATASAAASAADASTAAISFALRKIGVNHLKNAEEEIVVSYCNFRKSLNGNLKTK